MAEAVQTIPRVFLGEALRQLRDSSKKSLDETARVAGKDRARLIKVLDGKATLTAAELESVVDFLQASPLQREEILALGVEARKKPSGSLYTDLVEGSHRRVAWLEAMAKDIWQYEKGVYPHLIQSPGYVRALMHVGRGIWWEGSDEEVENRVTYRIERQRQAFESHIPKQIEVLLSTDTLDATVGGPDVMQEQRRYVIDLMDQRRSLTVRVVPVEAKGNPASSGGLTMYRFGEALRPVGFLPTVYGPSVYYDKVADTERIMRAFNKLRELALSPEESREHLEKG